ncbi:MAG: DUF1616 domain-containing protein [Anaerolineae bacterium]
MNRSRPVSITFHHDLAAIVGLSFLLVLTVYLLPLPALRIVLGGPFVLFFPGYIMTAALFPGRDDLEGLERLGLSLGLSIAILPLMGLVLNYTPWGITMLSTLLSAISFIVGCSAIAYYRRRRLPLEERYALRLELDVAGWRSGGVLDRSLTVALAVSIFAALGTFLFVLAKPEVGERFTEFYVLGPYGEADDYPRWVLPGQLLNPIVGVINREHQDMNYRIRIEVGGQEVEQITDIHLAHDEKWEKRVVFSPEQPGDQQQLRFLLYREGQEEPYRSLHLWIDVRALGTPRPVETRGTPAVSTPVASSIAEPSPTPSPTPRPAEAPTVTPQRQVTHIVQPGETLSSIARQYRVTSQAIMEANGLEDPNLLEVGQELIIPQPE